MNKDIDENHIEDVVFDILIKHGIIDAITGNNKWDVISPDNNLYHNDSLDVINSCVLLENKQKTFTLEHVINIVKSMSIEMNIRHEGIFEYKIQNSTKKSMVLNYVFYD